MQRIISNEDLGQFYPCHPVDLNPYCQIAKRGYNMSCDKCREGNWKGPYWHQFLLQDQKKGQ